MTHAEPMTNATSSSVVIPMACAEPARIISSQTPTSSPVRKAPDTTASQHT
jgi:hypothetical protein